ncbi:hypothetical protein MMYC01_210671 [Madurella mycetomatis]|uniref:BTB domain-containing protein n=1 Tax=Madurella mycetomatis TaxID=100816 RepID=A0A175VNN2_9PEZI|nr:hypothetical protein MMYC01_210671 [Madurella mycetomatis]
MSSCTHTLATPGDTILTLNNPSAPFAVWDEAGSDKSAVNSDLLLSTTCPPVTYRVSSQHLIQASSFFKAALTGRWKEGSTGPDKCHEISTEDWDAEALRIVLCLIHNRTREIPRTVTLEMLCKIAVLVDYYEFHEALHFFASLWMDHLQCSFPTTYGRDLMLWICISWVFKDATIFKNATKLAIEHSPGKVPTLHLPIPESVISRFGA